MGSRGESAYPQDGSPAWRVLPAPTPEIILGYRISTGLGIRALCKRHCMSERTWSAWELGTRRMPRHVWTYLALVDGLHPELTVVGRVLDAEHWETVGERGDPLAISWWESVKGRRYPDWARELVASDETAE